MTAVVARRVSASYNGSNVVDSVDLSVDPGSWLGIIGPNGAGKTTLLRALTGQVRSAGSVLIADSDIAGMRRRQLAAAVAVVPQTPVESAIALVEAVHEMSAR